MPGVEWVTDDRGRALEVSSPRERIVSLIPGLTETIVMMGGAERLLARTRYDIQEELAGLPSVGGGLDPSLEFLVDVAPDLVVLWPDRGGAGSLATRLDELGIESYGAAGQDLEDFRRHSRNLGRLLGLSDPTESLVRELDEGLSNLQETLADVAPVPVLYLVQEDPPMTSGSGTFVDSLIVAAGARSVFDDTGTLWPTLSFEEIIWRDPAWVVIPVARPSEEEDLTRLEAEALDRLRAHPSYAQLAAVKDGRVVAVEADLFGRLGPRMADGAVALARRLHPDRFAGSANSGR